MSPRETVNSMHKADALAYDADGVFSGPVPLKACEDLKLRNAKKILVVNMRYIGDTVWTIPFIRNLKRNLPHAEVSALVNTGGEVFLDAMPEISEVICFDRKKLKGGKHFFRNLGFLSGLRKKRFDAVFVLSNSDRPTIISYATGAEIRIGFRSDNRWRKHLLSEKHTWDRERNPHMIDYYLQALTDSGLKVYDRTLAIDIPAGAVGKLKEKLGGGHRPLRAGTACHEMGHGRKAVVVHPGARGPLRQWGAENFAEVINALHGRYKIFLIGGPGEEDIVKGVMQRLKSPPDIASTDLGLMEFAALCSKSDLFIGNDSAPIHIAAASGLFVIGIYGPTVSKYCGPWTDRKFLFDMSDAPCRPCMQDACACAEFKTCLKDIRPADVAGKAENILGALGTRGKGALAYAQVTG